MIESSLNVSESLEQVRMVLIQNCIQLALEDVIEAICVTPNQRVLHRLAEAELNSELVSLKFELAIQDP